MKLFFKRLGLVFGYILSFTVLLAIAIGVVILATSENQMFQTITNIVERILIVICWILMLIGVVGFINWLFIEPFRKNKSI